MDRRNIKITGGLLSIAILLISGWAKVTRLPINPASISIGINRFFQRVLEGVNFQLTNVAGFNSNWNATALLLLSDNATTHTRPVRVDFTGNNITGNGLNSNFPACIQTRRINISTNSRYPDVISDLTDIGYFRKRFT